MSVTINTIFGYSITPELISNSGEIAALAIVDQSDTVALWQWNGAPVDLQTPTAGANAIVTVNALNASSVMVGTVTGLSISSPTVWQNGSAATLSDWSGDNLGSALGLNDFGIVVGFSLSRTITLNPYATSYGSDHALVWTNGTASLLSPLSGDSGAMADSINDSGEVVGVSFSATAASDGSYLSHAVSWINGTVSALAPVSGAQSSGAWFVNTAGDVAGEATFADGTSHAVLWHNGVATDLGSLTGYSWSQPSAINDLGQVVGTASTNDSFDSTDGGVQHAVLWQNGKIVDLNSLLSANDGIVLQSALSVNDAGEILCYGTDGNATDVTFILDLTGSPAATVSTAASVVQAVQMETVSNPVSFADTAADVVSNLDGLQTLAATGKLGTILLIDSTTPTLTLTDAQLAADAGAWTRLSGNFVIQTPSATVDGFSGAASQYSVSASPTGVTVSGNGISETLSNVFALQFADQTDIVAAPPGTGAVTTGNVTELYAAVLDREPDIAGLAFYQNYLNTNPNTPLLQFAEWFLSSPEYTAGHSYAQTSAGDQQFITDSYQNLLHRTPTAAEIAYYQTSVMAPALANLTPGTTAYATADFQAHAQMLVYFSASPEFLSDVQVIASQPASAQHWLVLT